MSQTGREREASRIVLAGYYADRLFLLWSFVWLFSRWTMHGEVLQRPGAYYEPLTWVGALLFPTTPDTPLWYVFFAVCFVSVALCLWKPRLVVARVSLALSAWAVLAPELSYGHLLHINHLFLLGHTMAVFLPVGRPEASDDVVAQARSFQWYQAALLFPYTLAGFWKWIDMTVRALLKPGMTWLNPDALLVTSVYTYWNSDLPLDTPRMLESVAWLFPIGYVALAFVFLVASYAPFNRPLLLIVLPAIIVFHLTNMVTLHVFFVSTCVVAALLLFPYDWVLGLRKPEVAAHSFQGTGAAASYVRTHADGSVDRFEGVYAYRARLRDRSWLLALPLYYPGVAWMADSVLRRTHAV